MQYPLALGQFVIKCAKWVCRIPVGSRVEKTNINSRILFEGILSIGAVRRETYTSFVPNETMRSLALVDFPDFRRTSQ